MIELMLAIASAVAGVYGAAWWLFVPPLIVLLIVLLQRRAMTRKWKQDFDEDGLSQNANLVLLKSEISTVVGTGIINTIAFMIAKGIASFF